jgi:hypothetical protein
MDALCLLEFPVFSKVCSGQLSGDFSTRAGGPGDFAASERFLAQSKDEQNSGIREILTDLVLPLHRAKRIAEFGMLPQLRRNLVNFRRVKG